jgi:ABC-2 type transport system permease protein
MSGETARARSATARPPGFAAARIWAMVLRNFYLFRGSWARVADLFYWPTVDMVVWGFTSKFLMHQPGLGFHVAGLFLAAVLLWDIFFRGQIGISVTFLEEIWSRSLGHLFITPLKPGEYLLSLCAMSFLRACIGMAPAVLLAIPFYGYSLFSLGPPLAVFLLDLLMFGWGIGLAVSSLILLYGLGAEGLAWFATVLLAPVAAVYYPVSVLPHWLQMVAMCTPLAHVFEAMRAVMFEKGSPWPDLAWATGLDAVFLAAGCGVFLRAFEVARRRGSLVGTGE